MFGHYCYTDFMIKLWSTPFTQGRDSFEDGPLDGRSVSGVDDENVAKVKKLLLGGQRTKHRETVKKRMLKDRTRAKEIHATRCNESPPAELIR
ncbi:hypothetical protein EVAR_77210_1 [Eumeta japonica]|uniref:Uncharacterized protein n=1 Tax=Eumeta variegata TaxID=151549 RepID=A0A4C1T510_EUMVA|nr:hypothetical protein EVAR_77210_1 [Eumeta japonica]